VQGPNCPHRNTNAAGCAKGSIYEVDAGRKEVISKSNIDNPAYWATARKKPERTQSNWATKGHGE